MISFLGCQGALVEYPQGLDSPLFLDAEISGFSLHSYMQRSQLHFPGFLPLLCLGKIIFLPEGLQRAKK